MRFRTVLIKNSSKLQHVQGYLVVYDGDKETKVFLQDISLLLIEAKGTLITVPLMLELIKNNVAVILCDEKHNPSGVFLGLNNHYNNSGNIFKQIKWDSGTSDKLWKYIVQTKILMQKCMLEMYGLTNKIDLLEDYIINVVEPDKTNREGLAAKVYFNEMFGMEFSRSEDCSLNSYLDYGYAILLSCFNREIISYGYLTQIGIFHRGKTNPFNLSSDFMEPFRVVVDIIVKASLDDKKPLERIRKLLTYKILINTEERFLDDAIGVYVVQLLRYLNNETMDLPYIQLKSLEHYLYDKNDETDCDV